MTTTQRTAPPAHRQKIVLVVRAGTALPQAVNAAVVLGTSAAAWVGAPGPAGTDAGGESFPGITTVPVPVLTASSAQLTELYRAGGERAEVDALALTEVARKARSYEQYLADLAVTEDAAADLVAVLLAGPAPRVSKLTRSLPLLVEDAPAASGARA